MKPNITRGRIAEPQKLVIYGPQGIGKSTLAALLPSPLFLDTERGTRRMNVARIDTPNLRMFDAELKALSATSAGEFQTIVVDTIDWLESRIKELVVSTVSAKDRSYGREESFIADHLQKRIDALSDLVDQGYNVCLLAHSTLVNVDLPDQPVAFQRYELDMGKKFCAPLVKHWADHLLFLKPKLAIRQPDEGKNKGVGNGSRILCFSQTAAYDAKARASLSGEHEIPSPPTDTLLRQLFADVGSPWGPQASTPAQTGDTTNKTLGAGTATAVTSAPDQPSSDAALEHDQATSPPSNPEPAPTPEPDTLPGLALSPEKAELARILAPHADVATAWLIKRNRIQGGQSFVDMDEVTRVRVLKNPAGFIKTITSAAA